MTQASEVASLPSDTASPVAKVVDSLRRRPQLVTTPLAVLLLLGVWQGLVQNSYINAALLPPPTRIATEFIKGIASGEFLTHALVTISEAATGFAIAVAAGLFAGALIAELRWLERGVLPWIVAIQTMPKIALAPLLIVWFGFGLSSKIAVAAVICFFPMLVTTIEGLRSADPGRLDVVRALSGSRWHTFALVKAPSALPYIFSGLSMAAVFSMTGAIVGEFVGASAGLGFLIVKANTLMQIPKVFAILALLGIIGMVCFAIIQWLRMRVLFWAPMQERNRQ